ncbi:hypothetical protein D3C81_607840 [compost metagenome]
MNEKSKDPKPYINMRDNGATPQEVYKKALEDGYMKSDCMMLIAGVFDMSLHHAREIAHKIYREKLDETKR